jgi:hypothetical protein
MALYSGACHCGTVRFEIEAEPTEMTTCDCSLCVKKNAVMIRVPEENLRLLAGEESLSTYVWNTGVARHHFCARCGIYTFHRKRAAPDSFGVNVFCLEGFDPDALPVRRADGLTMSLAEPRS